MNMILGERKKKYREWRFVFLRHEIEKMDRIALTRFSFFFSGMKKVDDLDVEENMGIADLKSPKFRHAPIHVRGTSGFRIAICVFNVSVKERSLVAYRHAYLPQGPCPNAAPSNPSGATWKKAVSRTANTPTNKPLFCCEHVSPLVPNPNSLRL